MKRNHRLQLVTKSKSKGSYNRKLKAGHIVFYHRHYSSKDTTNDDT